MPVAQLLHTILKLEQNFKHLYHIKNELNFIWIFIRFKWNQTMLYALAIPDSPHASKAFFHFIHCRLLILHLFLLTSKGIWDAMVVSLLAGEMKSLNRRSCHGPKPQLVSDMHCWAWLQTHRGIIWVLHLHERAWFTSISIEEVEIAHLNHSFFVLTGWCL